MSPAAAIADIAARLKSWGALGGLSVEALRGVASVMAIRVAGAGLAYLSEVLLARWLGVFEFGVFTYAWVWVMILGPLAPLGFSASLVRFISHYTATRRWARALGVIRRSRTIILLTAPGLALLGALATFLLRESIPAYYVIPLYVALAAVPVYAMLDLYEGVARGFGWVKLAFAPRYVVRPALVIVLVGVAALAGIRPSGAQAMGLIVVVLLAVLIGQAWIVEARVKTAIPAQRAYYHSRYWLRVSLPFVLIEAFQLVLTSTDVVMLGLFLGPQEVAVYFAAIRTANLIAYVSFAVTAVAAPRFSALHATGRHDDLQALVSSVAQWTFWPSLAVVLALLVAGPLILGLFGPGFEAGYPVLLVAAGGQLLRAATGPIDHLLNMTGHQDASARVLASGALLNIALNAALIPALGLIGAALASLLSVLFSTTWLWILVRRRLGLVSLVFLRR